MSVEDPMAGYSKDPGRQKAAKAAVPKEADPKEAAAKAPAETGSGPAFEAKPAPESAEERLKKLAEENAALKDQLLRRAAEFENSRKRLLKDKEEGIRYANAMLLGDVISIIDGFERAIQSSEQSRDFASFHSGVTLIERQLVSVLERNWGLKRFAARTGPDGEPFDPEKHQAIAVEQRAGLAQPLVLENYQNGYYLHGRVLRPAQVKVAMPIGDDKDKDGKKE